MSRVPIKNKLGLTAKDFNISEEEFWKIDFWLTEQLKFKNREDALDYHVEESEEDLFNWIHDDSDEDPISIKQSPLPSEMKNVCQTDEGWYFWYI